MRGGAELRNQPKRVDFVCAAYLAHNPRIGVPVVKGTRDRIVRRSRGIDLLIEWRILRAALRVADIHEEIAFGRIVEKRHLKN